MRYANVTVNIRGSTGQTWLVCIDIVFILICNKIDTSYKIILVFLSE
jgi:hypothetical protein